MDTCNDSGGHPVGSEPPPELPFFWLSDLGHKHISSCVQFILVGTSHFDNILVFFVFLFFVIFPGPWMSPFSYSLAFVLYKCNVSFNKTF